MIERMIRIMIRGMRFIINYVDTLMDKIHDFAHLIVDRLVFDSRSFFDDYMKMYPPVEKESTEEYEYILK